MATASGRRGVAMASGLEGAAGDGVGSGARATATAAGQPGGVDRALAASSGGGTLAREM